jgi:hypothetical protein
MNLSLADVGKPVPEPTQAAGIPAKYRSIATTTASYDVKEGDNEINVELTD